MNTELKNPDVEFGKKVSEFSQALKKRIEAVPGGQVSAALRAAAWRNFIEKNIFNNNEVSQ